MFLSTSYRRLGLLVPLFLLLLLARPSGAAEKEAAGKQVKVPEVVRLLKARVYNLSDKGLKTLEAEVKIPIALLEGATFKLYFRAPDRQALDVEGVDPEMKVIYLAMLKDVTVFTRYLFGLGNIIDYLCKGEIKVTKEKIDKIGEVTRIEARPRKRPVKAKEKKGKPIPDLPEDLGVITIWVNKDLKPVRLLQEQGESRLEAQVKVMEKDKKYLISGLALRKGRKKDAPTINITISYTMIKGYWLPSLICIPNQMDPDRPLKVELRNYRLNVKLPQHVFKKEVKKKKPAGKDEDF
jgi:outer membrane lipoprotein-sorting protein